MAERKKKIKVRLRKMVYIVILLDKAFVGYIKSNRQFCSPGACYTIAQDEGTKASLVPFLKGSEEKIEKCESINDEERERKRK